jgi:hypothetical protein
MQVLVDAVEAFCRWSGLPVSIPKSEISGIDHSTGARLATDGIRYHGQHFTALPPDKPFKFLGVRITMTGDASFEKSHVLEEMEKRCAALCRAPMLSPTEKELVLKLGVASVFRYSAGLVPWRRTDLENMTKSWVQTYRVAWRLPRGADTSILRLDMRDGGRGCPSALEMWIKDVLSTYEQCLRVPGEVHLLTSYSVAMECKVHGCTTLSTPTSAEAFPESSQVCP